MSLSHKASMNRPSEIIYKHTNSASNQTSSAQPQMHSALTTYHIKPNHHITYKHILHQPKLVKYLTATSNNTAKATNTLKKFHISALAQTHNNPQSIPHKSCASILLFRQSPSKQTTTKAHKLCNCPHEQEHFKYTPQQRLSYTLHQDIKKHTKQTPHSPPASNNANPHNNTQTIYLQDCTKNSSVAYLQQSPHRMSQPNFTRKAMPHHNQLIRTPTYFIKHILQDPTLKHKSHKAITNPQVNTTTQQCKNYQQNANKQFPATPQAVRTLYQYIQKICSKLTPASPKPLRQHLRFHKSTKPHLCSPQHHESQVSIANAYQWLTVHNYLSKPGVTPPSPQASLVPQETLKYHAEMSTLHLAGPTENYRSNNQTKPNKQAQTSKPCINHQATQPTLSSNIITTATLYKLTQTHNKPNSTQNQLHPLSVAGQATCQQTITQPKSRIPQNYSSQPTSIAKRMHHPNPNHNLVSKHQPPNNLHIKHNPKQDSKLPTQPRKKLTPQLLIKVSNEHRHHRKYQHPSETPPTTPRTTVANTKTNTLVKTLEVPKQHCKFKTTIYVSKRKPTKHAPPKNQIHKLTIKQTFHNVTHYIPRTAALRYEIILQTNSYQPPNLHHTRHRVTTSTEQPTIRPTRNLHNTTHASSPVPKNIGLSHPKSPRFQVTKCNHPHSQSYTKPSTPAAYYIISTLQQNYTPRQPSTTNPGTQNKAKSAHRQNTRLQGTKKALKRT
eukprot:gene2799-1784_t